MDVFHQEKNEMHKVGLEVSSYIQIDDTGTRVNGQNYYNISGSGGKGNMPHHAFNGIYLNSLFHKMSTLKGRNWQNSVEVCECHALFLA